MSQVETVSRILSLLPVSFLEWLLTAFAWLQLYILAAKSKQSKLDRIEQQDKKKRKKKKSGGRRRKSIINIALASSDTGPPPVHTLPSHPHANLSTHQSEVDVLGDNIMFEANEQHRREFEGFLRSVKDIKDVQNWLKNFSNEAPRKIAIVKLSRRILETDYGTTQAAAALSFMFKFGLFPIVVHGGWNELTRDTCSEVLARRKSFSQRLKAEIRKCGVGAAILSADVCTVQPGVNPANFPFDSDKTKTQGGFVSAVGEGRRGSLTMEGGLSFEVQSIEHSRFTAYLEKGKIPIWDGVAVTTDGTEIPLNGDVTTVEIAQLLQPFRIIFACNDGGILDKDNKAIPVVYMDKDYEDLMSANWVSQRRKIQLLQVRRIVSVVPPSCTVVVTAIDSITHQLMYPRLANETIVKRAEENIVHVLEDMEQVDKAQLKLLIEDSFGRPLAPDYLANLYSDLYRLYLITGMDGEYNGCAIITHGVKWEVSSDSETEGPRLPHPQPYQAPTECSDTASSNSSNSDDEAYKFYYLCKFCVRKSAQGLGLGDLLWRSLQRDIDKLYWRSRTNNPLNAWYYARCQGSFRTNEHFTIFWYGDDRFEDGASLITDALAKPVTILPVPRDT